MNHVFPGGGLAIFTDRDNWSIFGVLNFENLYFWGVLVITAVFFELSSKCCIFKCFIFSAVFLVLHYYHLTLKVTP